MTVPHVLQMGTQEKACATFQEVQSNVNLTLVFKRVVPNELLWKHEESFPAGMLSYVLN